MKTKKQMSPTKKISFCCGIVFLTALALMLGYLIIGELVLPDEREQDFYELEEYSGTWERVFADGHTEACTVPQNFASEDQRTVTIQTVLGDYIEDDHYIILRVAREDLEAYVDGQLRYSYSTEATRLFGATSPASDLFIPVNADDAGKTLTLCYSVESTRYAGIVYTIYYGNYAGMWVEEWRNDGFNLIVGLVMIVVSLISILISFYVMIGYHSSGKLAWISICIFLMASWMLANLPFRQLFFPNESVISDLTFFTVLLMPMPLLKYFNELQQGRYQTAYVTLECLTGLEIIVTLVGHFTNLRDMLHNFYGMAALLALSFLLFLATLILDMVHGHIREYKLMAIAILIGFLVGGAQIVVYLSKSLPFNIGIMGGALLFALIAAMMDAIGELLKIEKEKEQAIILSNTKSEFLANMSHEIRTPLNAVLGMDELIMEESTEPAIREYAKDIDSSGRLLLSLINDILDFSKIESGKLDIVESDYEIADLVKKAVGMVTVRAQNKGLELVTEMDETIPYLLHGDDVRIHQIMLNILSNAVKYSKEGTIHFRVGYRVPEYRTMIQPGDRVSLVFSVEDQGQGIRPEDIGKLFNSFERMNVKENRSIEGTGLGLAITKRLLDLMGGTIAVESEFGKGSKFTVEIPQQVISEVAVEDRKAISGNESTDTAQPTAEAPKQKETTSDDEEIRAALKGMQILAVDDVEMNVKMILRFLKDYEISIDTAYKGADALGLWEEKHYDLVLLDHMMPEMDGIECLGHMRGNDSRNPDTPVIALTANAISGAAEKYKECGFNDYLSKPFHREELLEVIIRNAKNSAETE